MIRLVCVALTLLWVILLVRVILSWIQLAGWRPPATGPLRSSNELLYDENGGFPSSGILPISPAGMFDLSVVVAFIIIFVLQTALCR